MIISSADKVPLEKCPALVLNADFRPLSYYHFLFGVGKMQLNQFSWIE